MGNTVGVSAPFTTATIRHSRIHFHHLISNCGITGHDRVQNAYRKPVFSTMLRVNPSGRSSRTKSGEP